MAILPCPSNVPKPGGAAPPKKVSHFIFRIPARQLIDRTTNLQELLLPLVVKPQQVYLFGLASCRPVDLSWANQWACPIDLFPNHSTLETNLT
jgi:hypothetical protein